MSRGPAPAPLTVSPAQPIYKELGTFGLEPIPWSESYLNIAPAYRAITDTVFCSVRGSNQGVDRLGESALIPFFDGGMSPATPFSYSLLRVERNRSTSCAASSSGSDFAYSE